jgi:hypothetical protein
MSWPICITLEGRCLPLTPYAEAFKMTLRTWKVRSGRRRVRTSKIGTKITLARDLLQVVVYNLIEVPKRHG